MAEVAQSYEMVRNFNNFKAFVMFAVKKLEALLMLLGKIFLDYAYVTPENFFDLTPPLPPPPSTTFSGKICTTWSKS